MLTIKDRNLKSLKECNIISKLHFILNDSIIGTRCSYDDSYYVLTSSYEKCQVPIMSVELFICLLDSYKH